MIGQVAIALEIVLFVGPHAEPILPHSVRILIFQHPGKGNETGWKKETHKAMKLVHPPQQRRSPAFLRAHDRRVPAVIHGRPARLRDVEFAVVPEFEPAVVDFRGGLAAELGLLSEDACVVFFMVLDCVEGGCWWWLG